jgi:UDP-N-acetylmuramoyl-L-alanyl-D-glutamate--2,6-diaminopimelate ligase
MNLNELLAGVPVSKMFQTVFGKMASTHDVMVSGIHYDSRKVERGGVFVALRGGKADGHKFFGEAIARGVKVVVTEDDANPPDPLCMHTGTVKLVVDDSRKALALMAANYYGRPAARLIVIGITGTNGKTTTAYLVKQMLESDPNVKAGLIGTVEYMIGSETLPATHTTPESLELHGLFARMLKAGCTHVVMEVSSHALDQHRVFGIPFAAGVFTNLTQDHLDYHHTMEAYFSAKKILFDTLPESAVAVVNADSPYAERIVKDTKARVAAYGIDSDRAQDEYRARAIVMTKEGFTAEVGSRRVELGMTGRFNILNFLAAYAVVQSMAPGCVLSPEALRALRPAPGRFEQFHSEKGWTAIVDYAHTPDAITNCLETIRSIVPKGSGASVTTVFGAGGDRDKTKRPLMGAAAEALSDRVIVTSDNPRTEDPGAIIDGVLSGMKRPELAEIEPDRRLAIGKALAGARAGDIVLVAGKGHEDYQVIGTEKIHLSDTEIVRQHL